MILDHPLTTAEQKSAQRLYIETSGLNGIAGPCSNSTLQALLALQLGFGSTAASCIGPMDFLRYSVLPLGFILARHFGVCHGKRITLTGVGILCLLIAASAWVPASLSGPLFFSGALLMSMTIATLWAMEFPLQKNITTTATLPRFLTLTQCAGSSASLIASLCLAWILHNSDAISSLPIAFCLGGCLYILSGWRIASMPEPPVLKQLASKPLLSELRSAFHSAIVRKQMLVGYVQNVILATMLPVNILAAKQACGDDDSLVLILTTLQTLLVILSSWVFKWVTERFGPRRMMIATWPAVWLMAAYWCLAPVEQSFLWLLPPFILAGFIYIGFSTSTGSYFTLSVPNSLQVGGTIMVYIFHGGLVGITGIIANPTVFKLTKALTSPDAPMNQYRTYFLITGLISLLGIIVPLRLPEFFNRPVRHS